VKVLSTTAVILMLSDWLLDPRVYVYTRTSRHEYEIIISEHARNISKQLFNFVFRAMFEPATSTFHTLHI